MWLGFSIPPQTRTTLKKNVISLPLNYRWQKQIVLSKLDADSTKLWRRLQIGGGRKAILDLLLNLTSSILQPSAQCWNHGQTIRITDIHTFMFNQSCQLLAPAEAFGLRPRLFFVFFGQKQAYIISYIISYNVVMSNIRLFLVFSSNLSNIK